MSIETYNPWAGTPAEKAYKDVQSGNPPGKSPSYVTKRPAAYDMSVARGDPATTTQTPKPMTTPQEIIESNLASSDKESSVATAEILHTTRTGEPLPKPASVTSPKVETTTDKNNYTQPDLVQKTRYDISQQRQRLIQTRQGIDPFQLYKTEEGIRPGIIIRQMLKGQSNYLSKQSKNITKDIRKYPRGTTFTKTKTGGYSVNIPESDQLGFTRETLRKTENKGIFGVFDRMRFGLESATLALSKPVSGVVGWAFGEEAAKDFQKGAVIGAGYASTPQFGFDFKRGLQYGKTYEKTSKYSQQHFVTVMDPIFEPIDWSPSGSSEILTEYPGFTAGGIAGEVGQSIAMGYAMKPVGKTMGRLTRGTIKRTSNIRRRIIPDVMKKLQDTDIGENIYKYTYKKYKPGRRLLPSAKISETTVEGGYHRSENILKKITYGGRKTERVFMSPRELKQAEKALKQIGSKVGREPMFELGKTQQETSGLWERTVRKGILRKRYVTTQKYSSTKHTAFDRTTGGSGGFIRAEKPLQNMKNITDDALSGTGYTPYSYTGRFRQPLYQSKFGGTADDWVDDLMDAGDIFYKKRIDTGYAVPGTRKTKLDFFTGPSMDDPLKAQARMSQSAVRKWQMKQSTRNPFKSFIQSKEATQSLMRPTSDTMSISQKSTSGIRSKLDLIMRPSIPGHATTFRYKGMQAGGYLLKPLFKPKNKQLQPEYYLQTPRSLTLPSLKPITELSQKTESITKTALLPKQSITPTSKQTQMPMQTTATMQTQISIPKLSLKTLSLSPTITTRISSPQTTSMKTRPRGYLPPFGKTYGGRGAPSWLDLKKKAKYRYREFKIPTLGKLTGGL